MTRPTQAVDAFYTPDWLADELAACLPEGLEGSVLDPSVGGGSLLSAVERRFGDRVNPLGIDVDGAAVKTLRLARPRWVVSHADLLSSASRGNSRAWRAARMSVSAVVLNPPFSYRGNGGVHAVYADFEGRVAPAMSFLVEVIRGLRPSAGIFAVLPDGAIDAEKHELLWQQIGRFYTMSRLRRIDATSFRGARVSTSLVQIVPGCTLPLPIATAATRPRLPDGCKCVEVIRGRVQVHHARGATGANPAPFIHTTNLASPSPHWMAPGALADEAPLVLITRVGHWSEPALLDVGRAVLSDCLIALRPRARTQVEALRDSISGSSAEFRAVYRGTGAKYLTLASTVDQLADLGWHPHVAKASSPVAPCCCRAAVVDPCAIAITG